MSEIHYTPILIAAENIFFKMLANNNINQEILFILSKSNVFHQMSDIFELYEKRWDLIKYNSGSIDALDPHYQILSERTMPKVVDYITGIVQCYPYDNHRAQSFLNNIENSTFFNQKPLFMSPDLYHSYHSEKSIDQDLLSELIEKQNCIGTLSEEWQYLKMKFYFKYPNLMSHVELIRNIMSFMVKMENCNPIFINESQSPSLINSVEQNNFKSHSLFNMEKLGQSEHEQIKIKIYADDLIPYVEQAKKQHNDLQTLTMILKNENQWIEEFCYEDNYYLNDLKAMFFKSDIITSTGIKLDNIIENQENKKDILWWVKINDVKMNHHASFLSSYLLPDNLYTQSFVFNVYIHFIVLWYQLNWTDEEYQLAQKVITEGTDILLKDYNYYNEDGSEKNLRQIIAEQTEIKKNNKNVLFGNRNNDIIKNLINIGEELVWNMSNTLTNTKFNNIIL